VNRNAWSAEERAEYDTLCAEAFWYGTSTRERTERYIEMLHGDEQAHRFYAKDCLDDALYRGAAAQLVAWSKSQKTGRIAISHEGQVLSVRRVRGTIVRDAKGKRVHTQSAFDFWSWEQLEAKILEYVANIRAYRIQLGTLFRLLDLRELAPGTNTPDEATKQLGTSVEKFLMDGIAV
jgi:hypothetical protein